MRVLVSVASRHGSTSEIGEVVAQVLREAGHTVDVTPPDDVERVMPYDAAVLGSSVYVGRLSASLRDLVQRQGAHLRLRPVWIFWSGPVAANPVSVSVPDDVAAMVDAVAAREAKCFVGALDKAALSLSERALVALVRAEDGDFRDFDAVRAWAVGIADELTRAA
ncbi:flavodoxin domain-containing protein [Cellulomonas sp.]|uniref:flavodoxin domain-containing protein n=1 Tax=Cellulomonas sp. TaxID=40001 RepID=UPI002585B665|nr:flavodoxin domain-containing protein [Cellulomonas sp.]MCR6690309.1 flavodoxin domain-containing protein [Cellulomonas sp.]